MKVAPLATTLMLEGKPAVTNTYGAAPPLALQLDCHVAPSSWGPVAGVQVKVKGVVCATATQGHTQIAIRALCSVVLFKQTSLH